MLREFDLFSDGKSPILIIAPHCDDELLACGGLIQEALDRNYPVKIIFLTNGDGFRWAAVRNFKRPSFGARQFRKLGEARQKEAINASEQLGLGSDNLYFLGYPDRGLQYLWGKNWLRRDSFYSRYTKSNASPYLLSFQKNQLYAGESLVSDLETIILEEKPGYIFISSSFDNHSDHWSAYNFLKYTLVKLFLENKIIEYPRLYQYLIHWNLWPMKTGGKERILNPPLHLKSIVNDWEKYQLCDKQRNYKYKALKQYKTQMKVMRRYLNSFINDNELFIRESWPQIGINGDMDDDNELVFKSSTGDVIFYEPFAESIKTRRNSGADIKQFGISLSRDVLNINLAIQGKNFRRHLFVIKVFILSNGEDTLLKKGVEIAFPARSPEKFSINNNNWVEEDKINIRQEENNLMLEIEGHDIRERSYIFISAESYKKNRLIDRASWKVIEVEK